MSADTGQDDEGMKERLGALGRKYLSPGARRRIVRYTRWPPVGLVRFGGLRRLEPISRVWGMERGVPIDRFYIERFLDRHADDIRGRVLEIGDDTYTRRFGGGRVETADVLHVAESGAGVTITGDLADGGSLESDCYDCLIVTQTLQLIYDVAAAAETIQRVLKPAGVALVTLPGISQISRYDMDRWGHYWAFTTRSAERLFGELFPAERVEVTSHGNVLAAVAFLHGLATRELRPRELEHHDPDYQLLITVRAVKPAGPR